VSRVSLKSERYHALVIAAALHPCFCPAPEQRMHDGKCISCWALAKRLEILRKQAASRVLGGDVARGAMAARYERWIAECEAEQRLRAEQLPEAERRLAEARKADG
jgi:hypothetical protein